MSPPGRKPLAFRAKALAAERDPTQGYPPTKIGGFATIALKGHHLKMVVSAGCRVDFSRRGALSP